MKLKTLIIDDEADGANVLKILLSRLEPETELVGIAHDLLSGVELIKKHKPQLVFLDVEMPNYAGYEIVNFFDKIDFSIVFVTAYNEYAIKAFEINAVDYLLKPVNRMRLKESVEKVALLEKDKQNHQKYLDLVKSMKDEEEVTLVIPELGKKNVVVVNDIIAIEANGSYSKVFLKNQQNLMISKNLGFFEEKLLDESTFFRTHKSWFVNTKYIQSYQKSMGEVTLINGVTAKLSKYRKKDFEELIRN